MASGVFGLKKVYKRQVENINNGNFASWPEGATYGYYGGGEVPSLPSNTIISSIRRLDFSTETTGLPGNNLPFAVTGAAAVSSSSYGYFGGGDESGAPNTNVISRFDFLTETTSLPGNNLSIERFNLAATSSSSYGYFGGGSIGAIGPFASTIDRLDFSTETRETPGTYQLSIARETLAAVSSSSYGYFGGGASTPSTTVYSTIDRLDFSTETRATPGTYQLSIAKDELAATSSSLYGYFGGGGLGPSAVLSTIDRLDFSTETVTTPGPKLFQARESLAATSNSSYGYFGGGILTPGAIVSTIDRLDFSTETVINATSFPVERQKTAAFSGGQSTLRGKGFKTYGYFGGGKLPKGSGSQIDRLDFSNETVSSGITLLEQRQKLTATSNNYYGYFSGGDQPAKQTTTISRFDFSNETTNNLNNFLPLDQGESSSVTSSNSYGYFGGGAVPSPVGLLERSSISRLDFSNETIKVMTPLPSARQNLAATSSSSYGYFGGGAAPTQPSINTITRIDFSNETVSNPGKNLPSARDSLAATSNNSFGYFGGGNTSIISRLDFSNETASDPGKNFPPVSRNELAGTPSSSYGYFGGGGSFVSTITRLDFSSETVNDITSKLSNEVTQLAATSNSN